MTFFIDKEVYAVAQRIFERAEQGLASQKEIALGLETMQAYVDHWEALEEKILNGEMKWDDTVTIKIDGQAVRFQNIEQVAEFLTDGLK
jgi:hypothetical protein